MTLDWLIPDRIVICARCGYRAWRDGYPCYRCGGLEPKVYVPEDVAPTSREHSADADATTGERS